MIDRTDSCTVQLGFCHCCCVAARLPVLPWRNGVSSGYSNKLRALDNKMGTFRMRVLGPVQEASSSQYSVSKPRWASGHE